MSLPALRLPFLRSWPAAPDITAGLKRQLLGEVLVLPAGLPETEREEIVDLLALFLDLPVRVVAGADEARAGELSVVAFALDREPFPVKEGVILCTRRRAQGDLRLDLTHHVVFLRDAIVESLGRKHSGTRLQQVASWARRVADSPSTALRFAGGALAKQLDDPLADDRALYLAGLVAAIAWLLRGVDTRVAQWTMALATGAPHPARLVSSEALLLGQDAAVLRALDAGLVLLGPEEPGDALELRRPIELLRHLDEVSVPLALGDVSRALGPLVDPEIRLVFDRLLRPGRKALGLEGPRPVSGFLGRDEVVDRLVTLCAPANELRTTVLHGVDGVGKTQVAAALCERLAARLEPVWVRFAEGPEQGWMRVASALGIDVNRADALARDRAGVPQWVRRVHDGLRFLPCLLVVEGVDAMREDELPAWLPSGEGTSTVLVVSRSAQRPLQRMHEAVAVRLAGLGRDAARRLLAKKAPRLEAEIARGEADVLIEQVGGHPGALSLAAGLLEQKTLNEVTQAVRRGEQAIPEVLRELIGTLPKAEARLVRAFAVCAPAGSPRDLALEVAGWSEEPRTLDRLFDQAMVVSRGRTLRLAEVVRLEVERRLDKEPAVRRDLEIVHAEAVATMVTKARELGDRATREDLYADLTCAVQRMTARCKGGEREVAGVLASVAYEVLWYTGVNRGTNARLAVDAYQAALAIEPANTRWQRELSVGYNDVGDALLVAGDTTGALAAYRPSLAICEQLARRDPTNTEWQRDVSVSHNRIGDVLLAHGDKAGALVEYRASLAISEQLTRQDPTNTEWQRDVLVSHNKIGRVILAQGDEAGALAEYRASLAVREQLIRQDPANIKWQRDVSVSHNRYGNVLLAQGDKAGALAAYHASLALREQLTRQDPANTEWQRDVSVSHTKIGNVLLAQGDKAGALAAYRALMEIAEHLAHQDPENTQWQHDLAVSHERMGDVQLAQADKAAARASYTTALAIVERLSRLDPLNAQWQADVAELSWKLAGTLDPAEHAEARAHLERARRILTDLAAASRLTHEQQQWLPKIEAQLAALPPERS